MGDALSIYSYGQVKFSSYSGLWEGYMCILNENGNPLAFAASEGRCFQKTLAPFKPAKNLFMAWLRA